MQSATSTLLKANSLAEFILFLVGAAVGGQLNRAIYRWAWNQRSCSPWSPPPAGVDTRSWLDCVPILGWWRLRREKEIHGELFWLRPLLIEFGAALGLPALYAWEMGGNLLPPQLVPPSDALFSTLLATFAAHAVLFALMMIATFIDIDEKTIPDFVTVPGTLAAILFAVLLPDSLLPVMPPPMPPPAPLLLSAPADWPVSLDASFGLWVGLACWIGWGYALLPKTIYLRRGWMTGARFLWASMCRHPTSKWIVLQCLLGLVAIAGIWSLGGLRWQALLSSLVGLAFAGGLVWAIRAVAGYVLQVEAMGFGDVTLMAMIGAFLGWQAAMVTFFLAPFTSLVMALSQWLITGRRDIPFGPFLCAAAAVVMLFWQAIWGSWSRYFALGLFIPMVVLVAIALMGVLLALLQVCKRLLGLVPE